MTHIPYIQPEKKVYLLTFTGFRLPITNFLDTRQEILNWFLVLPQALLMVSRKDAPALTKLIHEQFRDRLFLITEVVPDTSKTNGWLNEKAWEFINDPKSSGRWE